MLDVWGVIFATVGAFLALLLLVHSLDNPADISVRENLRRAAPGLLTYLALWSLVTSLVLLLEVRYCSLASIGQFRNLTAIVLGALIPQAQLVTHLRKRPSGRFAVFCLAVIQVIDEWTRIYLQRIIDREERKISLCHRGPAYTHAINAMYENHQEEILIWVEHKSRSALDSARLSSLTRVRSEDVKRRLLLRYLGKDQYLHQLAVYAAKRPPDHPGGASQQPEFEPDPTAPVC